MRQHPIRETSAIRAFALGLGLLPLVAAAGWAADARRPRRETAIRRDRYGVPHLIAPNERELGSALGRVQCEDRAAQVNYNLNAGSGRLAEYLGPASLEADRTERRLRHREIAERDWPKLPRALRSLVEGYVQGVNDWFTKHPTPPPFARRRFDVYDVIGWHRSLLMRAGLTIARIDGNAPVGEPQPVVAPGQSNAWAVAGIRSATGKPVLLIDPHWPIEGNLQLYEARLRGGSLDAWGFMPVGTPLVAIGCTAAIAWTFTAGGADSSDAFALRLNPADPNRYEFDGKSLPLTARRETIRVKEPDCLREVTETFRYTPVGPVLRNDAGEPYAAALPGWDDGRALEQVWKMNTARSAADFRRALRMDRLSYFNVVCAAAEGDIGYVQTGMVPRRASEYNWERRVPGWTNSTRYRGMLSFSELPRVENPPIGFLQCCNTAANVVTPGLTFSRDDFPPGALYGHYGAYRARGQRATDLLREAERLDLETAGQIAFDTYCPHADLWVPLILRAVSEAGDPIELREAAALLREWDRHVEADSAGATLFRFWRFACDELKQSQAGRDAFQVPDGPAVRRDALAALRTAVADLQRRYGRIAVPWGEIKRLRRGDREWPLSGDGLGRLGLDTLRATAADRLDERGRLIITGGQSNVALVFLGRRPEIHAVVGYGQSNDPISPHFADQAPLYAACRLRRVSWTHPGEPTQ